MKILKTFWIGLAAVVLFATGCVKDDQSAPVSGQENGVGTITIGVRDQAASRSLINDLGEFALGDFESNIANYSVFVFDWASGALEQRRDVTGNGSTTLSLNSVTKKRIIAIANLKQSDVELISGITSYAALQAATMTYDQQAWSGSLIQSGDSGILMTGQYPAVGASAGLDMANLTVQEQSGITIPVVRVVAKIELGNIKFGDDIAISDMLNFRITDVGVQKITDKAFVYPGATANPSEITWMGTFNGGSSSLVSSAVAGILGSTVDITGGLYDILKQVPVLGTVLSLTEGLADITGTLLNTVLSLLGDTTVSDVADLVPSLVSAIAIDGFWYVLPNSDLTNPTLLVLKGSYNGTTYYYPIAINATGSNVTGNADLLYKGIQRNTRYVVNLTFNTLIGSTTPEDLTKPSAVTVNIEPVDWYGPVNQETTW